MLCVCVCAIGITYALHALSYTIKYVGRPVKKKKLVSLPKYIKHAEAKVTLCDWVLNSTDIFSKIFQNIFCCRAHLGTSTTGLFSFNKAYIWYSESGTLLSLLNCVYNLCSFFLHIESELIDPRKPSRFGNFSFFGEAFRLIKDLEEISVTQRPQEMPLHFYSAPCFFSFLLLHDVS